MLATILQCDNDQQTVCSHHLPPRRYSPHDLHLSVSPSWTCPGTHHERPSLERRGVLVDLEVKPSIRSVTVARESVSMLQSCNPDSTHLNSLASSPQISLERLMAAMPDIYDSVSLCHPNHQSLLDSHQWSKRFPLAQSWTQAVHRCH